MRPRKLTAFVLSGLGAALLIWSILMNTQPVEPRKPMHVKVRAMETVVSLLNRNDVPSFVTHANDPETRDSFLFLPVARADERYTEDPSQITLTYDAVGCPITFPAGRQMQISFEGPFIDDGYLIYPMETMTWDEMQVMVSQTVDLFEQAGWPVKPKPEFGPPTVIYRSITMEQLNEVTYGTKFVVIGHWMPCDDPRVEVYVEVRHLNSSPSGPSIPPTAAVVPRNVDAEDRFVMLVNFRITDRPLQEELYRLVDARRMAENGNTTDPVPLSRWIEDPAWRPEGWVSDLIP
jgi:hypothetical protein